MARAGAASGPIAFVGDTDDGNPDTALDGGDCGSILGSPAIDFACLWAGKADDGEPVGERGVSDGLA